MLSFAVNENRRIYPLISIVISIVIFVLGLLMVKQEGFPYFLLAITLTLVLFGYGKALLYVLAIMVPMSAIVFLLALITVEPSRALENGYRAFLLGFAATMTISIEPVTLVRNLNQLGFPKGVTLTLLIALRFIGVLKDEMSQIRCAMKTRGADTAFYKPSVIYRAFIIPFMSRILSISETLSDSLETRGYSLSSQGTSYRQVKVRLRDICFTVVTFAIVLWFVISIL